jgi:hypothetical protein
MANSLHMTHESSHCLTLGAGPLGLSFQTNPLGIRRLQRTPCLHENFSSDEQSFRYKASRLSRENTILLNQDQAATTKRPANRDNSI